MWRGRNFVGIWCDELVDIRTYDYAARYFGAIDVVMRTPTQVIHLRWCCRIDATGNAGARSMVASGI